MKTKKKSLFAWFGRTVAVGLVPLMMFGCATSSDSNSDKDSVVNQDPPTFSTDPSEGDVITGTSVLKVTFNESVTGVDTTSVVLKNNAGVALTTTASSNGNTYSFDPSTDLVTGNYYLTVGESGAIKDGDGQGATAATVEFRVEDALTTIAANLQADLVAAGISSTDAADIVANAPTAATAATLTNDLMNVIPAAITGGLAYIGASGSSTAKSTLVTSVIESANGATSLTTSGRTITRVDATAFNELLSRISTALTNAASDGVVTATEFGDLVSAASAAISNSGADADQVAALQNTLSAEINTDLSASTLDSSYTTAANTSSGGQAGSTYDLETGVDTITGGSGDDTIRGFTLSGGDAWSVGDTIDGGGGTDTFTIVESSAVNSTTLTGATVTNVEVTTVTSSADITMNTSSWTGLTSLTTSGVGGATITAAATTDVVVTDTAMVVTTNDGISINGGKSVTATLTAADATDDDAGTEIVIGGSTAPAGTVSLSLTGKYADGSNNSMSNIATTGGTSVSVTTSAGLTAAQITAEQTDTTNFTVTQSDVSVTGNSDTTAVTVTQEAAVSEEDTANIGRIGIKNGDISVLDANRASTTAAGTIATVSLNNYGATTVNSGALSTLNLTGTGGVLTASTLGALTTPAVTTLALNVNGLSYENAVTSNAIAIDSDITTLNVNSSTAASTVTNLTANGVTSLTVAGDAALTMTDNNFGALTSVTVTNTAGVTFGTTAIAAAVPFTGGPGNDSMITTSGHTVAIDMGAGNDTVTYGGAAGTGGSVAAGDGIDVIIMSDSEAAGVDASSTFNTTFTGFETLRIEDAFIENALDLDGINSVSTVELAAGISGTAAISNLPVGGTLKVSADGAATPDLTVNVDGALSSGSDSINLQLSKTGGVLAAGDITIGNVETINIDTSDAAAAGSDAVIHTLTLQATAATSVVVSGNNGLNLTNTGNTAITSFDASGVVANSTAATKTTAATTDSAANLAVTFTSANTTTTATVAITGGEGNDTLAGNNAKDTITGGEGADTITPGQGTDTIVLTETTAAVDTLKYTESGATHVDSVTGFNVGTTDDIVSVSIGSIVDNGAGNDTLSNMNGADIGGALAAGGFTPETVAVNTNLTAADATNLLFFSNTSATTFATAIGTAAVTATTGTNTGNLSATEGVMAVWYDADTGEAVVGYIEDTDNNGTALTSADTHHEIVRIVMSTSDYTSANVDAMLAAH